MSRQKGELRTCDRCGKQIFCKSIGDGEMDGGYTRWNKFEQAEGWSVNNDGDLCSECTAEFEKLKADFWKKNESVEV